MIFAVRTTSETWLRISVGLLLATEAWLAFAGFSDEFGSGASTAFVVIAVSLWLAEVSIAVTAYRSVRHGVSAPSPPYLYSHGDARVYRVPFLQHGVWFVFLGAFFALMAFTVAAGAIADWSASALGAAAALGAVAGIWLRFADASVRADSKGIALIEPLRTVHFRRSDVDRFEIASKGIWRNNLWVALKTGERVPAVGLGQTWHTSIEGLAADLNTELTPNPSP